MLLHLALWCNSLPRPPFWGFAMTAATVLAVLIVQPLLSGANLCDSNSPAIGSLDGTGQNSSDGRPNDQCTNQSRMSPASGVGKGATVGIVLAIAFVSLTLLLLTFFCWRQYGSQSGREDVVSTRPEKSGRNITLRRLEPSHSTPLPIFSSPEIRPPSQSAETSHSLAIPNCQSTPRHQLSNEPDSRAPVTIHMPNHDDQECGACSSTTVDTPCIQIKHT